MKCLGVIGGIADLQAQGAEGVSLGSTEIKRLIDAAGSPLPVFDSTALHAAAAVNGMLDDEDPQGETR